MALAHLRIRVSHLLLALGGVVLLIAAVLGVRAWRSESAHEQQVNEGLESLREQPRPGAQRPPRFMRGHHFKPKPEADNIGEGVAMFEPPPIADPGDLGPAEAAASFEAVLGELQQLADDERRLSKQERAELYNRATGSFTAMSAWVDPSDANEQAMMNDAHAQMLVLMRELDIEPPPVDPDRSTFRP